jgi:integrase
VYRLRMAVPAALRQPLAAVMGRDKPVTELVRTLGTHDPKEAKERMPEACAWASSLLDAARNGSKPLTNREAHALAGAWYRRHRAELAVNPAAAARWDHWDVGIPSPPWPYGADAEWDSETDGSRRGAQREWDAFLTLFLPAADALLAAEGMAVDAAGRRDLAYLLSHRLAQAEAQQDREQSGDYGVREGRLTVNPADRLRMDKAKTKPGFPYTDAEAALILNAARKETTPGLRWAHWIMAFTGMRAGEVLQLAAGDIRSDGGVDFIHINEDDPTKTVKTSERRNVPVHPALIAEGFLAYVATVAGDGPLFPEKGLDQHGHRGGRAWNLTGKWVRESVGIVDKSKAPDHSWRHRFEDELRVAEAPDELRDAIVGHARKTTGRQYGTRGVALRRLRDALALVPVPPGVVMPP